jgi:hypothetical protein
MKLLPKLLELLPKIDCVAARRQQEKCHNRDYKKTRITAEVMVERKRFFLYAGIDGEKVSYK